ncbi:Ig-like domain-containing protein, partial [Aeromonas hydrophila]|uniref:Ig-like domain-containing protein n=1 Tax=Aeromonas hydrophila TaxID=644 RepID=UPI0022AFBCBF
KPTLNGKAEAGSTITVKNGSTVIGSAVADASGNWSFTPAQALADVKYSFTVIATDKAGNTSVASDPYTITVDTEIAKPTIVDVYDDVGTVKGTVANNDITDDATPTLSGKAEAGATVAIKNGAIVLGTVVADASGNWSYTPSQALADGKYTLTAVATDAAGNVSAASDSYTITIKASQTALKWNVTDNYGPEKPHLNDGDFTDDNKFGIWGYAPVDTKISIWMDGKLLTELKPDTDRVWQFWQTAALSDGAHVVGVTFTDALGNVSALTTKTINVDTVIAKPTITAVTDDVGSITGTVANNGVTDDNKPTLSGKADAGSTVTVKNGSTVVGSVVADASGNWSFTPSTTLADGKYAFTVVATDKAG